MFSKNDEEYLIRALSSNRVLLFLGAGFSYGVQNNLGRPMPLGRELGEIFWSWLGYDGEYDQTPLADMYEAVCASGRKERDISALLESQLMCSDIPEEYFALAKAFWYRIYTTNVDNVIDHIYVGREQKLESIAFPDGEPRERDQSLAQIQATFLHGKLPCRPGDVTFSVRQYARRASKHDPLYDQFVRDYATHPTIFLGSQLNEPLFWQYIEAREDRPAGISEQRQKSFLISDRISPPKQAQLERFNVVPVTGTTQDFLRWLEQLAPTLPSRIEVVRRTYPDLADALEGKTGGHRRSAIEFAEHFHSVPLEKKSLDHSSTFLLGASPQWEDILQDRDVPREVSAIVSRAISSELDKSEAESALIALLGSAGCGKSTILRRVGLVLAQKGRRVFLTNSEEIPSPNHIARALEGFTGRAILLFDNAEVVLGQIPALMERVSQLAEPPVLVIASRTNDFDRRLGRFSQEANIQEIHVPSLTRGEIVGLIALLDENNLLGRLQGMDARDRIKEFEVRSQKQILISMREATSGRGFDEILKNEFDNLEPEESKLLYLCVALTTDAGYRITIEEFVGCARVTPAEALHLLRRNLRDIIVSSGPSNELLMLRHRTIAECAVMGFAPRPLLQDAYIRLLKVLATQVLNRSWRARSISLYRQIINHQTIYQRLGEDINQARDVYNALASYFKRDAQFWLQYGSLELEAGYLELAENYLNQAESLSSRDRFIQNAKGHLLLAKAVQAPSKAEAIALRDAGSELLSGNMDYAESSDPYTYHIYCTQRHKWLHKWVKDKSQHVRELEHLLDVLKVAVRDYPRSRQLRDLQNGINEEYLSLAVGR